jgi:hypothetical protein|tara:strand:- start:242 stop:553 length:312 start_codon:yes stop_codon:yes gene_type:complete
MEKINKDYFSWSSADLKNRLEALKKAEHKSDEDNDVLHEECLQIVKILFDRSPKEDIDWVRRKLANTLAHKDHLSQREKEFAQMSPEAIARWRYAKFGGRKDF